MSCSYTIINLVSSLPNRNGSGLGGQATSQAPRIVIDNSNVATDRTVRPDIGNNLASRELNVEVHREDEIDVGDEAESDNVQSEEDSDEQDSPTKAMTDNHRRIMKKAHAFFPSDFKHDDSSWQTAAQEHFGISMATPRMVVKAKLLHGSYLDTPARQGEDPNTGMFPDDTKFPKGKIPFRHGYSMKPQGRPFDFVFENKILNDFLTGPKLNSVSLDESVFLTRQDIKLASDLSANTDFFLRNMITDALYANQLLDMLLRFMAQFKQGLRERCEETFTDPAVEFVNDMIALCQFSVQRSVHHGISALTSNKSAMRERILNKFIVPAKTRKMLKLSSLTSPSVFGKLPKEFMDKFQGTTGSYLLAREKKSVNAGGGKAKASKKWTGSNRAKPYTKPNNWTQPATDIFHKQASHPRGGGRGRGNRGGKRGGKN